jgi:hypothetical protein
MAPAETGVTSEPDPPLQMKQFFIALSGAVMYNQYRSTSRPARVAAAAAALVTVWFLFDFVAMLADVRANPVTEVRASSAAIVVSPAAQLPA